MAAAVEQQPDSSKTLVAFVVGLLIGGLLVWAFSSPADDHTQDMTEAETAEVTDQTEAGTEGEATMEESEAAAETPALIVGDGAVEVVDQPAGSSVALDRATYPIEEGWIGVRDYNNGQLSFIKGVIRFSAAGGLVPQSIPLQAPTQAGQQYAVVMFSDNGDNAFNPAGDVQIDQIFATFTAQ